MTPGAYFAARRRAHHLTVDELAGRLDSLPHVSALDRAAWLKAIEADLMPARHLTIVAISEHLALDLDLLAALDAARVDRDADVPPHCYRCGVTPRQAQEATAWPSANLCPSCPA